MNDRSTQPQTSTGTSRRHRTKCQSVRSLRELARARLRAGVWRMPPGAGDAGLAEILPFPFLALVGQPEMKLALLLALINPAMGGVLLVGPRGTGKTTAVRSLIDLLPQSAAQPVLLRLHCRKISKPAGSDAVCPECARKYGRG